jgi:isopenicillin-N N-acyltransferase-like protein
MGRDYGRQTADLIRDLIQNSKDTYSRLGYSGDDIGRIRERHEDGISSQSPEIIEEIRGMAEGAGVPYERLMETQSLLDTISVRLV